MVLWASPLTAYLVQSVLHGFVALVVTEAALQAWRVRDPRVRFRYRLTTLVLPAVMNPVFQLIRPTRGDFYFRQEMALLDSGRWLGLRFFDDVALMAWLVGAMMMAVALITLMQEIAPSVRRNREAQPGDTMPAPPAMIAVLDELARKMATPPPSLWLLDVPVPVMVTVGVRNAAIYVSPSLVEQLTVEELRAALCHELAHAVRRSNLTTLWVFFLRLVQIFNPVALLVFRRLVQDDEQVCDDLAVRTLGDGRALAAAIEKLLVVQHQVSTKPLTARERIEEGGFRLLLRERIERLRQAPREPQVGHAWEGWLLCVAAVVTMSYFIV